MVENLHKKVLTAILISILVLAFLTIYADLNKLIKSFKNFKWFFIIPVLIFSLLNYLVRFFRWEFYLKKLGVKISTSKNFLIFLSGLTMSITPGKLGEALKSYLLKITDNVPISRSAPIVVFERLIDFIAFVILALYGSLYFNYGKEIIAGVGFVVITSIFIFSKKEIVHLLLEKTRKVFGDKFTTKINTAYNSAIELSDFRILIPTILISTLSWFFECIGFYIVIYAYSIDISLNLATFIYSFSTIAGAISMLPGGLGPTEGSMTALLVLNQVPKDIAVAITIIIRFATLWFAVVLGLIALYLLRKKIGKVENA
ncbi:MAG: lysylphosphatidylglycerol synthase transmembrane domain-containing protein [Candidatus Kryptonium sp.]